MKWKTAYLLLGSNTGDRKRHLMNGCLMLAGRAGMVIGSSAVYESEAWGEVKQPAFLNRLLVVKTEYKPEELLALLKLIETEEGRTDRTYLAPRPLDIDILLYNDWIIETPELIIPHPRLHLRRFALLPLAEVAANIIHPFFKKSILQLLEQCPDRSAVHRC